MPHLIKVADADELPPGKGKTLSVSEGELTIYNQEGRYIATATWSRHLSAQADTVCHMPGHKFDVDVDDSPARLRTDELHYQVHVDRTGVYVLVPESHVHPGTEPRESPKGPPRRSRRPASR